MASGQQVRCSAHRLRQQDGPSGRRLRARDRPDQEAPGSHPGPAAAADRLRRELQGPDRPDEHEGRLLGDADMGMTPRYEEIPEELRAKAEEYRSNMVEAAAEASEELMNKY